MFLTGGFTPMCMYDPMNNVQMYDIERDIWSECPQRLKQNSYHSSLCVNGKLFIFFGSYGGNPRSTIERFDA